MYVHDMLTAFDSRMEDPGRTKYPDTVRILALRSAQITMIEFIHHDYFTELQEIQESMVVTAGKMNISSISNIVIRGAKGICAAKVHGGKWITIQDFRDAKDQESPLYAGTLLNPTAYIFGNKIFFQPTTITLVDMYYLRMPIFSQGPFSTQASDVPGMPSTDEFFETVSGQDIEDISDDWFLESSVLSDSGTPSYHLVTNSNSATGLFWVSPAKAAASTDFGNVTFYKSELNPVLHNIMLKLAEAEMWDSSRDFDREAKARAAAFEEIEILNQRYEKLEGTGTKNRK